MRKTYVEPKLDVFRVEVSEALTSDLEETLSGIFNYGEDVEEW